MTSFPPWIIKPFQNGFSNGAKFPVRVDSHEEGRLKKKMAVASPEHLSIHLYR